MSLRVVPIAAATHRDFIASRPSVSFLQVPEWGDVKRDWESRSLGWFDGEELIGVALVLSRNLPRTKRWLAYIPEGPDLPWDRYAGDEDALLAPMLAHLRDGGAFLAKIGPTVPVRQWSASTLKRAIGGEGVLRLRDVKPAWQNTAGCAVIASLGDHGWTQRQSDDGGFGDVQPRYVFQIPLRLPSGAARSEADLFAGFNQLWRRNVRKAEKAGVHVSAGGRAGLADFHPVYRATAIRDGFVPRPLTYFERMWDALNGPGSPARMSLYLARWEGQTLAATTMITVGDRAWYSYGASANEHREVKPSNAIQWRMIRDALRAGMAVYDLRGITDTLDPADRHFGLTQFKLGTGGDAVEYVGEWDFALRPATARAFDAYVRRAEIKARLRPRLGRRAAGKPDRSQRV